MGTQYSWLELRDEFRRLACPELVAEYTHLTYGANPSWPHWALVGGPRGAAEGFRAVARLAAVALGLTDGPDAWSGWLLALRENREGVGERPIIASTGSVIRNPARVEAGQVVEGPAEYVETQTERIPNVYEASALFCLRLASLSHPAVPVQPAPASEAGLAGHYQQNAEKIGSALSRNIERLRLECGWTFDELAHHAGMTERQVRKHCQGKATPRPGNTKIYAVVFARRLDRALTVEELKREAKAPE